MFNIYVTLNIIHERTSKQHFLISFNTKNTFSYLFFTCRDCTFSEKIIIGNGTCIDFWRLVTNRFTYKYRMVCRSMVFIEGSYSSEIKKNGMLRFSNSVVSFDEIMANLLRVNWNLYQHIILILRQQVNLCKSALAVFYLHQPKELLKLQGRRLQMT